ncbi:MAG: zeta toxin family protein [Prolixibacteraceae bacterium]|jgi:predicted ABC-type ATPase|nr:zeta toxin family protein [Prolixibacteraceae bacterium]
MPDLTIIAGCNGAGKSTFAPSFLPEGLTSFDYDRVFWENYDSLPDSELRETFAKHQTAEEFELSIENALLNHKDFCYETNFDTHPLYWLGKFKEKGYQINLIFFCLDNMEIARHRVQVRTEFKGHFVDNSTINLKWKEGYKNVNQNFRFFDNLLFVDNSKQNDVYINLLQIEKEQVIIMAEKLPYYFMHRLPEVYAFIKDINTK